MLAEVTGIDPVAKRVVKLGAEPNEVSVRLSDCRRPALDTDTSAIPSGRKDAPGLKSMQDAHDIRQKFLLAFEHAEVALTSEDEREAASDVRCDWWWSNRR